MLKQYYQLTKPGIIYGNAITLAAGFFLGLTGRFSWLLFLFTLVGLSFVIASGCVCNNYFDRDIDARMQRTKQRALVTKKIPARNAIIFAMVLLLLGLALLAATNLLTLGIAFIGFVVYVGLYTPLKRRTIHATLVGAIAGAVPPVVGYTAVANRFDIGALVLCLILVSWQMAHFFSIAIYRLDEYRAAGVAVFPLVKGIPRTKASMLGFVVDFLLAVIVLFWLHYAGWTFLAVTGLLGLAWLVWALYGFSKVDPKIWARQMFVLSLVVITFMSISLVVDSLIRNRI